VEAHRGTITVVNKPVPPGSADEVTSGGARFTVVLPAAVSFG
jgi:signal transduction histidine kinase